MACDCSAAAESNALFPLRAEVPVASISPGRFNAGRTPGAKLFYYLCACLIWTISRLASSKQRLPIVWDLAILLNEVFKLRRGEP